MISRRNLLAASVLVPAAACLAACSQGPGAVVTITQTYLNAAAAIEAGFASIKGLVPASTQATISALVTKAETLLGGLNVGALVPLTSVQSFFTDAEAADQAVAALLPTDPVVQAIGLALPILAALAQVATPAAAEINPLARGGSAGAVDDLLRNCPYHGLIKAKTASN